MKKKAKRVTPEAVKPEMESAPNQKARKNKKPVVKKEETYGIEELKEEVISLQKEGGFLKAELSKMQETILKQAENKAPEKRSQLDLVSEIEDSLHKRYTAIKNVKRQLLEARKKASDLDEAVKAGNNNIADLNKAISRLKDEMGSQKKKHQKEKKEQDRIMNEEADRLKERISILEKTVIVHERSVQGRDKARARSITEKDKEISDLKKAMVDLERSNKVKDEEIEELKDEFDIYRSETAAHEGDSKKTRDRIARKDREIAVLKKAIKELEGSAELKGEDSTGLRESIADLESVNNAKDEEISKLKEAIQGLQERAGKGLPATDTDKEITSLNAEIAWLKELNEVLRVERGFAQKEELTK